MLTAMDSYSHEAAHRTGILIVGAGIAGLAAAKTLLDANYHNFIILEAQSTPGGRIHTQTVGSTHLEIGAQWIHGTNNELYKLANQYNLIAKDSAGEGTGIFIREDGFVFDKDLVEIVDSEIGNILKDCEEFYLAENGVYPKSVGQYLEEKFAEYVENDSHDMKLLKYQLFDWHRRFQIIDNSCRTLKHVSAKFWGAYALGSDGQVHINVKNGYSSLVKFICDMLPKRALQLKTCVETIKWNAKSVLVDCKNGQSYEANYVIVTASIGYLKQHHQTLFQPQLPFKMQETIERTGFWGINKIFLQFDTKWWNVQGYQIIWNDRNAEQHWLHDISGFDTLKSDEFHILVGWIGGNGAKVIEQISEEDVGIGCVHLLRQFTGMKNIPYPVKVIRSKWLSNPYVCGAYSYRSTDCDATYLSYEELAKPLTNENGVAVMALAGEALHCTNFSTTHGAYESGQNQAKIALQKLLI